MNEFEHGVTKQERVLAVVEPPRHFVKVGCQMLCRNTVPSSHNPALQERECRLDRVCVNVPATVNTLPVLDRLVFAVVYSGPLHSERVGHKFIGHNHVYIVADVLFDVSGQRSGLYVLSMEESKIAAALAKTGPNPMIPKDRGRGVHL